MSRRSCLSVPGSSPRKIEKAQATGVDELVFDLEDSVAAAEKGGARAALAELLRGGRLAGRTVAVRVNGVGTPWFEQDVKAIGGSATRPLSLVIPKAERGGDIRAVEELLEAAEAGTGQAEPIRLQALIETAAGIAAANEIAAAGPRLDALIIGYADLAASLGRSPELARDPTAWLSMQDAVLLAARAHDLQAIDGPWLGTAVDEPFERAARRARDLGFDGKWAIHPAQVDTLNALFLPGDAEIDRAERILRALEQAGRAGDGAAALDGEMIDEALAAGARRVLARAKGGPG